MSERKLTRNDNQVKFFDKLITGNTITPNHIMLMLMRGDIDHNRFVLLSYCYFTKNLKVRPFVSSRYLAQTFKISRNEIPGILQDLSDKNLIKVIKKNQHYFDILPIESHVHSPVHIFTDSESNEKNLRENEQISEKKWHSPVPNLEKKWHSPVPNFTDNKSNWHSPVPNLEKNGTHQCHIRIKELELSSSSSELRADQSADENPTTTTTNHFPNTEDEYQIPLAFNVDPLTPSPTPMSSPTPYPNQVIDLWDKHCTANGHKCKTVRTPSILHPRIRALYALLTNLEAWNDYFTKFFASDYLQARKGPLKYKWNLSDLLKIDNALALLEGKYDDQQHGTSLLDNFFAECDEIIRSKNELNA